MQETISQLTQYGVIRAGGEDVYTFLQAQLTCDLSNLASGESGTGAWCSPQGRVIVNFVITRQANAYYLLLHRDLAETVSKKLSMFVLRSRVAIENLTDDSRCIGLVGKSLALAETGTEYLLVHHPQWPDDRLLILAPNGTTLPDWLELPARPGDADDDLPWRTLDINTGVPWISAATTEKILPQELGLDSTGGLSYKKGCFPGQEIIARLHYRGQVKNGLYQGYTDQYGHPLTPGTRLFPPTGTQKVCGTILDSVYTGHEQQAFLAVVEHAEAGRKHLLLDDGSELSLRLVTPDNAATQ